ncbi:MAG: hypothetical protein WBI17_06980 [Clostridiaceae bacterium]
MKETRHELLKVKWREIIREQEKSGISIRKWCENHQVSAPSFFYWIRVIRQDLLIKAGTMAVTGQPQFSEITPEVRSLPANASEICAVIRRNGSKMEIRNGADAHTLELILSMIGRSS